MIYMLITSIIIVLFLLIKGVTMLTTMRSLYNKKYRLNIGSKLNSVHSCLYKEKIIKIKVT